MTGFITTISSPTSPAVAPTDPNFSSVALLLTGDYPVGALAYNSDGSDNSRLVTPFSTVRPDPNSPFQDGYYGVQFNGSSSYLSASANVALELGGTDFTIESWIYGTSFAAAGGAVINNGGMSGSASYLFRMGNDGSAQFAAWSSGSTVLVNISAAASSFPLNRWNHAAITRSGNTWTIWANGVSVATTSVAGSIGNGGRPFYLAYENNGSGTFYQNCRLSNVRIVKGASLYNTSFTPPTSPLENTVQTTFLTCQTTSIIDRSASNISITNNSASTIILAKIFVMPLTTGSAYFNGTSDYMSVPNPSMSGNWTVEFWTYPTSTGTLQMMTAFNNAGSASGMGIFRNSSGNLALDDGISLGVTFTSAAIPVNTWSHVAITRNGTTVTGYLNGVSVGSGTFTPLTVNSLLIGRFGSPANYFTGYLSNLRVVIGTVVYTGNFTSPRVPLGNIPGSSLLTCQTGAGFANTTFIDSSPLNNVVTVIGAPRQGTFSPYSAGSNGYSVAAVGGSCYFDGSSAVYLSTGSATPGAGNFTVECWVNRANTGTYAFMINNVLDSGSGDAQWSLNLTDIGRIRVSGWYTDFVTSSVSITANAWNHVAAVRNGTTLTIYLNGTSVGSVTNSTNFSSTTGLYIGRSAANTQHFTGYIANARVTPGVAIYTANFTAPTAPVTATARTTALVNFANAGVFDNAMKTDLQTFGTAGASTIARKFGSSSIRLDDAVDGSYLRFFTTSQMAFGSSNFTLEFWINYTTLGFIIDFSVDSTNGSAPILYNNSANTLQWWVNAGGRITSGAITSGVWNHIAICRSGTSTKMFLNGTQTGSTFTDTVVYTVNTLAYIGCSAATQTSGNPGAYIDDFRITSGVARYTADFTPSAIALPVK